MNKRSAKKYIQYRIADAIDLVSAGSLQGVDEQVVRKKIDELIGIYDQLIVEVNRENRLAKGDSRKRHFHDIFARLNENIRSVHQ